MAREAADLRGHGKERHMDGMLTLAGAATSWKIRKQPSELRALNAHLSRTAPQRSRVGHGINSTCEVRGTADRAMIS